MQAHPEREDLIRFYFCQNYSYTEIVLVLWFTHGISISLRHLKRLLRSWHVSKRISWSPYDAIFRALKEELAGAGSQLGYKLLWHRLKIKHGLKVKRSVVLQLLHFLNIAGVAQRRARRLQRRVCCCPDWSRLALLFMAASTVLVGGWCGCRLQA